MPIENLSRRDLLKAGAASALLLGFGRGEAATAAEASSAGAASAAGRGPRDGQWVPNDFLRIDADGTVTVISKHLEMGQGIYTGLATLIAEELDASWDQLRVEGAPADASRYANLFLRTQGTGGSTSLSNSFDQYRKAGATARAMLVSAAAERWNVPASEIAVEGGRLSHAASGQVRAVWRARCGCRQTAGAERREAEGPEAVPLHRPVTAPDRRTPQDPWRTDLHAGRSAARHGDGGGAASGATRREGEELRRHQAKAVKGVQAVVAYETPALSGVAVIAKDFWSARKGRDALRVEWDESTAHKVNSSELFAQYRSLAATPGKRARWDGDPEGALAGAARKIEAVYEFRISRTLRWSR